MADAPMHGGSRMSRGALTVARVSSVPIRLHWSMLLALPFFAWLMASTYFGTDLAGWLWGAALAIALFASVTIHELAHSLVAMRRDVAVQEIILLPIGGASVMRQTPEQPRTELVIAIVGPLTSLALAALVLVPAYFLGFGLPLVSPGMPPAVTFVLMVGFLNLVLGLFNLLVPAFPMDGGRVLRSLLATRMGLRRATRIAARTGRGIAVLMGFVGLFGGSILLVLIGIFVWFGARAEEQGILISTTLEGVTLGDIMTSAPATVPSSATVEDALQVMLETKHLALPITQDERPVGIVTADIVAAVPREERAATSVGSVASKDITVMAADAAAPRVLQDVLQAGIVAVTDAAGRLLGVVTQTDVLRLVEIRSRTAAA